MEFRRQLGGRSVVGYFDLACDSRVVEGSQFGDFASGRLVPCQNPRARFPEFASEGAPCLCFEFCYFPASFFAISSTIFGRRSAITLSTMLAIVLASGAALDAPPAPTAAKPLAGPSCPPRACFAPSTMLLSAAAPAGAVRIWCQFDFPDFDLMSFAMDSSLPTSEIES